MAKFTLEENKNYEAELNLGWKSFASNDRVRQELVKAGFKNVEVSGSGENRIAKGLWPGKTQEVALPEQVKKVTRL